MNSEGMDKLDREIIEALKEDARMSYSDIGERVGLSRVAVKNRISALEKAGIIQGYKVIVDETKGPEGVSFTLDIEALPEEYQNVVQALARDRYIRKIYSTTGKCRIHCVGFAPNHNTARVVTFINRVITGPRKIIFFIADIPAPLRSLFTCLNLSFSCFSLTKDFTTLTLVRFS